MTKTELKKALIAAQLKAEREAIRLAHRGNEPRHAEVVVYDYPEYKLRSRSSK